MILQCVIMLICGFSADFAFALYARSAAKGNAVIAANWSVMIAVIGAISILFYVSNPWLVIPELVGYWFGTYVAIRYDLSS